MAESFESYIKTRRKASETKKYLISNPEQFNAALNWAFPASQNTSWIACWMISQAMKRNDPRLIAHIPDCIASLNTGNDGYKREVLNVLSKMKITLKGYPELFDKCLDLWEDLKLQSSVRSKALQLAIELIKPYPELRNEILLRVTDQQIDAISPGIQKGLRIKLKKL